MQKNKYYPYVLALGHGCSDLNQGALAAILPFVVAAYHYDYTTASLLVTVSNLFGSFVQPIFGSISDKKNKPWIMGLGVFLACGGMALTGLFSNFYSLCVAVVVSGIGVAMFHPQAAVLVSLSSEKKQGKGIGIFSFGGKLGSTLGPVLTSFSIVCFGMKGTLIFLLPSFLFGLIFMLFLNDFNELSQSKETLGHKEHKINRKDNWSAFLKLCVVVFGRSILTNGMSTFLAFYCIQILGQSESFGNVVLSFYFAIGALAALVGGSLGDWFGYKKLICTSFFIFCLGLMILPRIGTLYVALFLFIFLAIAESLSYSPMVVLGQNYLPNHSGFASGITLGLAVSVGALLCPLLGFIADGYGLVFVFYTMAGIGFIAWVSSLFLPKID